MNSVRKRLARVLLILGTCSLIGICSCDAVNISGTNSSITLSPSTAPPTAEVTLATMPATPTSEPVHWPPTAAPTAAAAFPAVTSVFIPRESFPDGQLFEEEYFAVLPGEGAYYNVFDCYGNLTDTFTFVSGEGRYPTGLYTAEQLLNYLPIAEPVVQAVVPEDRDEYKNLIQKYENGYYQTTNGDGKYVVYLYDMKGELFKTLEYPYPSSGRDTVHIHVGAISAETIVAFMYCEQDSQTIASSYGISVFYLAPDGSVARKTDTSGLPGTPVQLLGSQYLLIDQGSWPSLSIYDLDGSLIRKNASVLVESLYYLMNNDGGNGLGVSDYYMEKGRTYDSTLQKVEADTFTAEGDLIFGADYDVDGITCRADFYNYGQMNIFTGSIMEYFAVGYNTDTIAVKTKDAEYTFERDGCMFQSMNDYFLLVTDPDNMTRIILIQTGEVIAEVDNSTDYISLSGDYLVVNTNIYNDNLDPLTGVYIIDKDGNIRFASQKARAEIGNGEYIVLYRGPYAGIADLNGDWIIKSLNWEMTRDEEYTPSIT